MSLDALLEKIYSYASCSLIRDVKPIPSKDIALMRDEELECVRRCYNYGLHFSCPPYAPLPSEVARRLETYSTALLVVFEGRADRQTETNLAMLRIEGDAKDAGFSKASAFFVYPCRTCRECPPRVAVGNPVYECVKPQCMRPTVDTCIDVHKTLENAGVGLKAYNEGEPFDMMSILLLK